MAMAATPPRSPDEVVSTDSNPFLVFPREDGSTNSGGVGSGSGVTVAGSTSGGTHTSIPTFSRQTSTGSVLSHTSTSSNSNTNNTSNTSTALTMQTKTNRLEIIEQVRTIMCTVIAFS